MPNDINKAMKELAKEINRDLDSFLDDVQREIERTTPKDTGRARKGWKRNKSPDVTDTSTTDNVIVNNVPYVKYLDEEHDIMMKAVDKISRKYR